MTIIFLQVFEITNQLLNNVSLPLFSAMSERQCRSLLKTRIKSTSSCQYGGYNFIMNKIMHGCSEIWNFSFNVQHDISLVCHTHL